MINNLLNNCLNRSSDLLSQAKTDIRTAADQKTKEAINEKIPSPNDFKIQIEGILATNNQTELIKAERVFNQTISTFDKIIFELEQKKGQLESIKIKLNQINTQLGIVESVFDIIRPIIRIVSNTLPALDGALASQTALAANGKIIARLIDTKKNLKDKIKKANDSINSFNDPSNFFKEEISKLSDPLDVAITTLNSLIEKIKALRAQILFLYENFIKNLILPELEEEDNEVTGNQDLDDYISNEDNISTIISDAIGNRGGNTDPNTDLPEVIALTFKRFKI